MKMHGIFKDTNSENFSNLYEYQNYKLIKELSDGIFHDFKNILANISGLTQLSLVETEANALKSNLKNIYHATSEFKEALNRYQELMDGSLTSEKKAISLNEIIDKSIDMLEFRFSHNNLGNIRLVRDIRSNSKVFANSYELNQVFINIVMNSIDAMEKSGGTLNISIYNIEETVCIRFNDTGVGISEVNQKKIFNKSFTTKSNGSGLGLPIAKATIEEHGGTINIKSKINQGTEVKILLPIYNENHDN